MQEDIEHRSVTLVISGSKLTGRMLQKAMSKVLSHFKHKHQQHKEVIPHGKQTVKELIGQNQGVSSMEMTDDGIRAFERIARKYGVDFAIQKVKGEPPKHLVFFKARDADALTAAFEEFTAKQLHKRERPSVRSLLDHFKALSMQKEQAPDKTKHKEISR